MKTITEIMAKRMREGKMQVRPEVIKWALQYAMCRKYGVLPR